MDMRALSEEILWAQADRSSGFVFSDRHGGATLAFSMQGWPGELFTLWMPENVHARGMHAIHLQEEMWVYDPGDGCLAVKGRTTSSDDEVMCAYRSRIFPIKHGLRLAFSMNNLTPNVWKEPWVNICLKLAHAPSFADRELARTYVRFGGRWSAVGEAARLDWREQYRIILPHARLESMLEHLLEENIMTEQSADRNLVAVVDKTGTRTVGVFSPDAAVLVFNGRDGVRCVHSNPRATPYTVAPGDSCESETFILFVDGPLENLVEHADSLAP